MIPKIPAVLKRKALVLKSRGIAQQEAAASYGMCDRTLRRAEAKQREFGDVDIGYKKRGRKGIWVQGFKDVPKLEVCSVMIGRTSC